MRFPKPQRLKDRSLLNEIKKRPCVCCGLTTGSDPDHILSKGAGGDDSENNVWPLCRRHHTERHSFGLRRLAAKYTGAMRELERRGFKEIVADAKAILPGQLDLFPKG